MEIDNGRNYTCFSKDENDSIFINLTQWADEEYAALKNSVYASINLTINSENISYIPEYPENATFWPASTAGAIMYGGEIKNLPQQELKNTFDKYYKELENRTETNASYSFTPYEVRIAEAFFYMNQKEEALKLLRFILGNRKPIGWNQFPEVINSPERTPTIFGDMPHTWVGAEYINAVRSLFVYELDDKLVIGHGIDEDWLERGEEISIKNFPTVYGKINYTMNKHSNSLEINVSGNACPPGGFVLKSPFTGKVIIGVEINGERWDNFSNDGVAFDCSKMPALINITNCDLNEPNCCTVNENCSDNQTCNTLNHTCQNLNCSEGYYPFNHTCKANETYCPIHTSCPGNETCNTTNNKCQPLNCSTNYEPFNHECYYKCDLDYDKIHIHDYNDLMSAYKCFLGIERNCNKINLQDWNLMKQEYDCFNGNY